MSPRCDNNKHEHFLHRPIACRAHALISKSIETTGIRIKTKVQFYYNTPKGNASSRTRRQRVKMTYARGWQIAGDSTAPTALCWRNEDFFVYYYFIVFTLDPDPALNIIWMLSRPTFYLSQILFFHRVKLDYRYIILR